MASDDDPETETKPTREELLAALGAAVIDLERVADAADWAARKARQALEAFTLELDDDS